jgi:hypothetical protein
MAEKGRAQPKRFKHRPCVVCGEPVIRRHPSRGAPKTCSDECAHVAMSRPHVRAAELIHKGRVLPLPLRDWPLLDSRSTLFLYIASNPQSTMRQMSRAVGLTESHIAKIIHELREAGSLEATRSGRRNTYSVNRSAPLHLPMLGHVTLDELHDLLAESLPGKEVT